MARGGWFAVAKGGFRRFLGLGDSRATPIRQFAPPARTSGTAPISPVSVDKKPEPLPVAVAEISTVENRKGTVEPRSRSGYVWVSQRTRETRTGWAGILDRDF